MGQQSRCRIRMQFPFQLKRHRYVKMRFERQHPHRVLTTQTPYLYLHPLPYSVLFRSEFGQEHAIAGERSARASDVFLYTVVLFNGESG